MKSSDPNKVLANAIQQAKTISSRDGAYFLLGRGNDTPTAFPRAAFAALHPNLPAALDFVTEHHPGSAAHIVRETLLHWANPGPELQTHPDSRIRNFVSFKYYAEGPVYVLRGVRYKTFPHPAGFDLARIAEQSAHMSVSPDWFSRHYPEIAKKAAILLSLGVEGDALSKQAMAESVAPTVEIDLSTVTFD